ncbi:ARF guanine-nucleotide exchange factor GNL2 [Sesamum angolense]|uniref:ARF guanine-nucleotide exchange factor GNL2 n=1 Tax=Sesamum angolense TaxID=2727404 RepID=A0AAE1WLD0_9LAMI|nr:ARF guanine-nucleotide exchange factor GNL2 [Sesamum angolense]
MSVLHLLSVTGRHPETYDQGVETLITLMSNTTQITRTNYSYCIDCAFAFVALRNSRIEKNVKIMDMLADTASLLVEWYRAGYSDPGSSISVASSAGSSFIEEPARVYNPISFFQRLGESLKKTSLARREEKRECREGNEKYGSTLKLSMEVLTDVYLHFLKPISESPDFRTFWLGILRRMDTCMKAELAEYGASKMPEVIPDLLRKIVTSRKRRS